MEVVPSEEKKMMKCKDGKERKFSASYRVNNVKFKIGSHSNLIPGPRLWHREEEAPRPHPTLRPEHRKSYNRLNCCQRIRETATERATKTARTTCTGTVDYSQFSIRQPHPPFPSFKA